MRALVVSLDLPYWPGGGGGNGRPYFLLRELSRRHEIDLVTFEGTGVRPQDLEVAASVARASTAVPWDPAWTPPPPPRWTLSRRIITTATELLRPTPQVFRPRPYLPAIERAIATFSAGRSYDLVQVGTTEIAGARTPTRAPRVLYIHDVLSSALEREAALDRGSWRRARRRLELAKARRAECRLVDSFQHSVVLSEEERQRLRDIGVSGPVTIVPQGVALDEYHPPAAESRDPDLVLILGSMEFPPNIDSAQWFVRDMLPLLRRHRPGVRLQLVGRGGEQSLSHLAGPGIEILGFVPDHRPYVARAGAVLMPVRLGVGVRFKVTELWAMAAPIVSTPMGVEGHPAAADGENVLVAPGGAPFADATARLLDDLELRRRIGDSGRRTVAEHYSWEHSARILEGVWEEEVTRARS
ncbi:MAG: glycosyltransferase family 4 protein [Candidatus Dormibacteria bacterium]